MPDNTAIGLEPVGELESRSEGPALLPLPDSSHPHTQRQPRPQRDGTAWPHASHRPVPRFPTTAGRGPPARAQAAGASGPRHSCVRTCGAAHPPQHHPTLTALSQRNRKAKMKYFSKTNFHP